MWTCGPTSTPLPSPVPMSNIVALAPVPSRDPHSPPTLDVGLPLTSTMILPRTLVLTSSEQSRVRGPDIGAVLSLGAHVASLAVQATD